MVSDGIPGPVPTSRPRGGIPASTPAPPRRSDPEPRELVCRRLSGEAERLRDALGLPLAMLPPAERSTHPALAAHTLAMNLLISGELSGSSSLAFLRRHLDGRFLSRVEPFFRLRFDGLWSREEIDEIARDGEEQLEDRWRRRLGRGDRWAAAARTLNHEHDFAEIWRTLPVGDFDVDGRGRDYTRGMAYFQAARAFGIESLLPLFAAPEGAGLVLDVLGGDGYILRIRRASGKLAEGTLWAIPISPGGFAALESANGDALTRRFDGVLKGASGALVLAFDGAATAGATVSPRSGHHRGRVLALDRDGVSASAPFEVTASQLQELDREGVLARPRLEAPAADLDLLLRALEGALAGTSSARLPDILTNDLSPHMFRSAGLWGMATREDARRLSRTFQSGAVDGVLFAYGTHHVPELLTAVEESWTVLRPGGRIVIHDFLDEGRVGRWFHEVVDRHSRTGHDFSHLGPVETATYLYLAGFRHVELYEMEDPFVFALPRGSRASARDIACTYLLGMYGMTESFHGRRERFEAVVREILSYPEIGSFPVLDEDFVYIPRRAMVATARRPEPGERDLSAADRELVARLSALFATDARRMVESLKLPPGIARAWFTDEGSRWGVSPELQRRWLTGPAAAFRDRAPRPGRPSPRRSR